MKLVLPWPPSLNNAYPTVLIRGKVLRIKSKEAKKFTRLVKQIVLVERAAKRFPHRLRFAIHMYPPDRRDRDISNHIKLVEDALKDACVMIDDVQIDTLHVYRMLPTKGGAVIVKIREDRRLFGAFPDQAELLVSAGLSPLQDGAPM